jgi:hypothetical protein
VLQHVPVAQRLGSTALASSLLRRAVGASIDSVSCSVSASSPASKQHSLLAWLAAHGQHVTALRGKQKGLRSNPAAEVLLAAGAVSALHGLTALELEPCGAGSLAHLSTLTALQQLALVGPNP